MAYAKAMLDTHPGALGLDAELLARCVEACGECALTCTSCADASLAEPDVTDLRRCISLDLDCSGVCSATAGVVMRQTEYDATVTRTLVAACAEICGTCAEECERHASHHEHCRICADTCRRCQRACEDVLAAIG